MCYPKIIKAVVLFTIRGGIKLGFFTCGKGPNMYYIQL